MTCFRCLVFIIIFARYLMLYFMVCFIGFIGFEGFEDSLCFINFLDCFHRSFLTELAI